MEKKHYKTYLNFMCGKCNKNYGCKKKQMSVLLKGYQQCKCCNTKITILLF